MVKGKILVSVIIGLVVVMGGVSLVAFLMAGQNKLKSPDKNQQKIILGGDKDEHGCIGTAGYTWSEDEQKCVRPWEENMTSNDIKKDNPSGQAKENSENVNSAIKKYTVAEKSELLLGGGREHKYFSIYNQDEDLINTVSLPTDAMPNKAGSTKVFGSNIYYLSGPSELTSIAELNPMTGKSNIFEFTKTNSTNKGNVLAAIVGWTVSDDNQMLAWVDTECMVHIADRNGTDIKQYKSSTTKCINAQVSFSENKEKLYIWDGVSDFFRTLVVGTGDFFNLVKTENGSFLMSPSEKYIIYSSFDKSLAILNLKTGKNIDITLPENYDFYYLEKFSADEKMVYVTASFMHSKEVHYSVGIDGKNAKKVSSEEVRDDLVFLTEKQEHLVGTLNILSK